MLPLTALPHSPPAPGPAARSGAPGSALAESARALETAFLAEMLKAADYGRIASGSGGGEENPFGSFMADAQAQAMMDRGGIGLARHIERSLANQSQEVS